MRRTVHGLCVMAMVALLGATAAHAVEFQLYENKTLGFSMKIPKCFTVESSSTEKTPSWIYQPGAAPAATEGKDAVPEGKKKGKGLGSALKGIAGKVAKGAVESQTPAAPVAAGGGLQPALTIYVNWVWMPDVDSKTMYTANKKSDTDDIKSPIPTYKELVDLGKKTGDAFEGGLAYRYKEVDKTKPDDIHRWHVKAWGNKSVYTCGFCGTFEQFKEWGPIYEEVIKSFKLIPMEKK